MVFAGILMKRKLFFCYEALSMATKVFGLKLRRCHEYSQWKIWSFLKYFYLCFL